MLDNAGELYEAVGRVVVPAAMLEQALETLAYAALGANDEALRRVHGLPIGRVRALIETEANMQASEWWSVPALSLLEDVDEPLTARNQVVHGHWVELRGLDQASSFVTLKPDRKSLQWKGQFLNPDQLVQLAETLESLREKAQRLADTLVEERHKHLGTGTP